MHTRMLVCPWSLKLCDVTWNYSGWAVCKTIECEIVLKHVLQLISLCVWIQSPREQVRALAKKFFSAPSLGRQVGNLYYIRKSGCQLQSDLGFVWKGSFLKLTNSDATKKDKNICTTVASWEFAEICTASCPPIGTVQWFFNECCAQMWNSLFQFHIIEWSVVSTVMLHL